MSDHCRIAHRSSGCETRAVEPRCGGDQPRCVTPDDRMYVCKDVYVNGESYVSNAEVASYIQRMRISGESVGDVRAAFHKTKIWPSGANVNVVFMDGPEWKRAWVEKVVTEKLSPLLSLIRLTFDPKKR